MWRAKYWNGKRELEEGEIKPYDFFINEYGIFQVLKIESPETVLVTDYPKAKTKYYYPMYKYEFMKTKKLSSEEVKIYVNLDNDRE